MSAPRRFRSRIHPGPRLLAIPESTWVESVVPGPDESLWIGTAGRVFHYRPDGIPPETMILHGKQDVLHREDLVLEVRGVERFKPLTRPGNSNVAVQVDDQPWGELEPLADGRVTIDNLNTGDHVVRVRVQDQGGDVDPTPAEWRFRLHTVPLQDRAWFPPLALGIFLTFLLLAGHCHWSSEELSREDSLNLYRVVQEALGNAML